MPIEKQLEGTARGRGCRGAEIRHPGREPWKHLPRAMGHPEALKRPGAEILAGPPGSA